MIKNLSEVPTITTKQLLSALANQLLVIYGGGGNLARLKLYRALAKLKSQGKIPKNLRILVIDKEPLTTGSFRGDLRQDLLDQLFTEKEVEAYLPQIDYLQANLKDPSAYRLIAEKIAELKEEHQLKRCVHYLAVWADLCPILIKNLGESGLLKEGFKVAIEKPCGNDEKSAKELIALLKKYCKDEQIFIIDHYLTKKQVQNILCARFGNGIYEPIWNHRHIDSMIIKAIESVDCKGRYDFPGLIKDMAGHLVQSQALLTMENPNSLDAEAISQEKVKVLKNTQIVLESVILGQFEGYKEEGHKLDCETLFVMELSINNARWKGTKFTILAMKAANGKATEAGIELLPNLPPFEDTKPNRLILDFHKDQLIQTLNVKVPEEHKTSSQPLVFDYPSAFDVPPADGYETILEAILKGDQSCFVRPDEVLEIWRILTPVLERLSYLNEGGNGHQCFPIHSYPQGISPDHAMELLKRAGAVA